LEDTIMSRRSTQFATMLAMLSLLTALFAGLLAPSASAISTQTSSATVNITFKACPPGGDWNGPPPGCVDTIEAPEIAMVTAPDWVQPVRDAERNADGSYAVRVPSGGEVGLVNFFSPNFNAFTFDGVDIIGRWYAGVNPAEGETRQIMVYYWNGPDGLIMPAENELVVNVSTCEEGINPAQDPSGCVPVTGDVPEMYVGTPPLRGIVLEDYLARDGGTFTYAGLPAYTQAQVVVHQPLAGYGAVFITGQAETIENNSATAFLLRNERRVIDVYFHAPDGSARTPAPTETPEANTGTLRLMLLSCPAGVVPHDDPGRCTEAMADDGSAMVTFPETEDSVALTSFTRDESGAYLVTGIQSSVTIGGISSRDRDRIASDADQISGHEITYNVEPGEIRDGRLYYFDEQ
jgi:hypothetical protein